MLKKQRGFTLIESVAALSIMAAVLGGSAELISKSTDKATAQVAAGHLRAVADATAAYTKDNFTTVIAGATPTVPHKITVPGLVAAGYLSPGFNSENNFGQTVCALALEIAPNKIETVILTTGGQALDDGQLRNMMDSLGSEGGGIYSASPAGTNTEIIGNGGGYKFPRGNYHNAGRTCGSAGNGGVNIVAGHGAIAQWFDQSDYASGVLYREAIPGRPELNQMQTNLDMNGQNINGANEITATGEIKTDANVVAAKLVDKNNASYYADPSGISNMNRVDAGQMRASIFYDKDDTGYYLDPNGNSRTNYMLANRIDAGEVRASIFYDKDNAGYYIDPEANSRLNFVNANLLKLSTDYTVGSACATKTVGTTNAGVLLSCVSGVWKKASGSSGYGLSKDEVRDSLKGKSGRFSASICRHIVYNSPEPCTFHSDNFYISDTLSSNILFQIDSAGTSFNVGEYDTWRRMYHWSSPIALNGAVGYEWPTNGPTVTHPTQYVFTFHSGGVTLQSGNQIGVTVGSYD